VTDSLARRRGATRRHFLAVFRRNTPQANRQLEFTRNCSAVSGACMLTRREVFQEVGGFDEGLMESLADIDLCLKMRRAGYLIVYTSFAKLCWHEPHHDKIDPPGDRRLCGNGGLAFCSGTLIMIQVFLAKTPISR
jgi:GT2 family glycosyltransferase